MFEGAEFTGRIAMKSTITPFRAYLLWSFTLMTIIGSASLYGATDIKGRWSGTFYSNHSDVAPFTITVVINPDSRGHLVGSSNLTSHCLKDAHLEVTVTGSNVVLVGSDKEGDNITLRGSVDNTGSLLKTTYILNGSASGACETDDGKGTLTRQ
jgi:hypothetical protein